MTPFGEYPQRHHTTSDPFIRPPFPYEYRTALAPDSIATGPAAFLTWKDSDDVYRINGTPTIWSIPYQLGAMLAGGFGPLSFRAAVLNSAPASRTYDWSRTANLTERPSFTGHAGVQVTQEFQVGASFSRGPYISTHLPATLDTFPILPGFSEDRDDYLQQIWGVDAALTRGSLQTRAEIFFDQRDVPNVADAARSMSWSAEAAYRFGAGFDVAARAGAINFQDIATAAGDAVWDYDARRYQVAAGYRLSESMDVRLEYMINDSDAPRELDANMLSARVAWNIDRFWGF